MNSRLSSCLCAIVCLMVSAPAIATDPVKPIKPKDAKPVTAKVERNKRGQRYTMVNAKVERATLGKPILTMACPPSGREIYALFTNEGGVHVVNPATMKVTGRIPTPRNPTSIWCNEKLIVVTCPDSKVVTVLDSVKRRPIKAFRLTDSDKLKPAVLHT